MGRADGRVGRRELQITTMQTGYELFVRRWAWLFPLTFLCHILEEYYGGFHHWIARVIGAELSPLQFLNLNAMFWIVMTVGITAAMLVPLCRWLAAIFAVTVTLNATLHLIGSVVTMTYSPGAVTGTILWLPLGTYTLFLAYKHFTRVQFAAFIIVGIILHLMVLMLAFNASRAQ